MYALRVGETRPGYVVTYVTYVPKARPLYGKADKSGHCDCVFILSKLDTADSGPTSPVPQSRKGL